MMYITNIFYLGKKPVFPARISYFPRTQDLASASGNDCTNSYLLPSRRKFVIYI